MTKFKKILSSFLSFTLFLTLFLGIPVVSKAAETNIALNKPATASSYLGGNTPASAFDNNTKTRWESVQGVDPQWLTINLGANYNITGVKLVWETAAAKDYKIQVSTDNKTWIDAYIKVGSQGGEESITFKTPINGQYVRMYGTARTTQLGYSLWDFQVFGKLNSSTSPNTSETLKKGVAACTYSNSDLSKLTNLKAGWFYNWNSTFTANTSQKGNLEYVPMLWGTNSVNDATINSLKQGKQAGQYSNLLAFNEPDLGSQSNMTVQQAIDLWPKLMDTGLKLGSPAVATPYDGWLDNFMTQANNKGYRVDFIALHFYQDFTDPNAVNNLKSMLTDIYNKYKKPIWITEIGTIDINSWGIKTQKAPTQQLADNYMTQVLPMLDGLSFVERYSWFTDNCYNDSSARYTSLYDSNNALTSEGKIYQGFSSSVSTAKK